MVRKTKDLTGQTFGSLTAIQFSYMGANNMAYWEYQCGWEPNTHIDKDILSDKLGIHPHVYGPKTCQWVSAKVNVGYATNRDNFGKHPNVRLSHKQVEEILNYYFSGEITNKSELARMYGVHCSSIRRLIRIAEGAE